MSEPTKNPEGGILIVDDEESLRITFELFLKREGYSPVIVVSTFDDALSVVDKKDLDLVISDIVLEGRSGIELLRYIREKGKTCPVIMITGYPNIKTAAEAVRLGAFDYLPKPVTKDVLLKAARLALNHRLLEKERQRAEDEKERYRYYLETVFRSIKDSIITIDKEYKIIDMNEAARLCFREMEVDVSVGTPMSFLPKTMGRSCVRDVERVISTRSEIKEHRVELEKPDGSCKVLSINAAPLEDGKGNFLGAVLVARDMTIIDQLQSRGVRKSFHRLIGASQEMQLVYTLIENVGKVDTTVLITGESGTGKELVAEALHEESPRRNRKLVKVDCTAIPENLLESELFGHKKGSFTGADRDRMGRILQADGGTIFLDEIGDISPMMQLRLLRFLQERTFYPVGQDTPIQVDVRVVAATNADLKKKVEEGIFREDLYFRLRVIDIKLPSLRERKGDIPILARHFIERFSKKLGKDITGISDQALDCFDQHSWPGNVRELEHVVERACVLCQDSTLSLENLPKEILSESVKKERQIMRPAEPQAEPFVSVNDLASLPEPDRIIAALKMAGGNKAKAARILCVDRSTIYRKLKEYNIDTSFLEM